MIDLTGFVPRHVSFAIACLLLPFASARAAGAPASAAPSAVPPVPAAQARTFVIVHGAWGGGWAFRDVDRLLTADGHSLAARCFKPHGEAAKRAVIIACALGVPQSFYARYATWLTQQGCVAYTFDWRGMGESAPDNLRHYRAKLIDWALQDAPAMMELVAQRHP